MVDYTKLPTDYVDRYTPEIARREGAVEAYKHVLAYLAHYKRPSMKNLIARLEEEITKDTNG